jgi:hypothetical protein
MYTQMQMCRSLTRVHADAEKPYSCPCKCRSRSPIRVDAGSREIKSYLEMQEKEAVMEGKEAVTPGDFAVA